VVDLRIYHEYYFRRQKTFTDQWEATIFNYLQLKGDPEELIKKVPRRKYIFLLELLRGFLISLKGSEYEKIADIIRGKKLYGYLVNGLNSQKTKRVITSSYFLGIARAIRSKELIAKKLNTKNEIVFIDCATSLAQMNAVEYADKILTRAKTFNRISKDTLLFILLEYQPDVCPHLLKQLPGNIPDYQKESIISLFRHFKYEESAPEVINTLVHTYNRYVIIECLKFASEVAYTGSRNIINRLLEHNNPMIRAEAIKTVGKLGIGALENKIIGKIFDDNYEVQLAAAETISTYIPQGREKLSIISEDPIQGRAASIARMVLSQMELRDNA
jgi:hypothetical protein